MLRPANVVARTSRDWLARVPTTVPGASPARRRLRNVSLTEPPPGSANRVSTVDSTSWSRAVSKTSSGVSASNVTTSSGPTDTTFKMVSLSPVSSWVTASSYSRLEPLIRRLGPAPALARRTRRTVRPVFQGACVVPSGKVSVTLPASGCATVTLKRRLLIRIQTSAGRLSGSSPGTAFTWIDAASRSASAASAVMNNAPSLGSGSTGSEALTDGRIRTWTVLPQEPGLEAENCRLGVASCGPLRT